jgi:hypothetical protein
MTVVHLMDVFINLYLVMIMMNVQKIGVMIIVVVNILI